MPRHDFLDWLRAIAIFVLLFFHTGMLFVGWDWHLVNADTIPSLRLPMDLAHRLRMPLLFVIAGAGMWYALLRRSGSSFLRDRALRLLLPLGAGMLLVVPPQVYVERVVNGQWEAGQGGYWAFFFVRVLQFKAYPAGDFSWHHLWFIAYLMVYAVLLLPLLKWAQQRGVQAPLRPAWLVVAPALLLALGEALLKPRFPVTHALWGDWHAFTHYLGFTMSGVLLAATPGVWDSLAAQRWRLLATAAVWTAAGLTLLEGRFLPRNTPANALIANVFTWWWLLTFLAWARQRLNFSNALLRWARQASYPVYILHQTVIIVIAFWVVALPWRPWTKYAVVLGGTMLACSVLFEVLRRTALTRLLLGMQPVREGVGAALKRAA